MIKVLHGSYYFSGRGTIGGYSAKFSIGGYSSVTVTDDMATNRFSKPNTMKGRSSKDQHTVGVGNVKNNINPGGSYVKLDSKGNIYSYTTFDNLGRQTMRIDFQGRPHNGVIPHIHIYTYPDRGGKVKYTFDFRWRLLK